MSSISKMTRRIFTILLGLTGVAFTSQALAQDVTPPTVISAVAVPNTIDVSASSQSVTLTVTATDDLSGIRVPGQDTRAVWNSPSRQGVSCRFVLASGTELNAVLEATCVIPQFAEAGDWEVNTLVEDNAGNVVRNSFSGLLTVTEAADLSLDKTVNNATPNFGTKVTFTIELNNNGPADADHIEVTDLLPAGLTFVSATPSQGTYDEATGLWTVGALANGTMAALTVDALVNTLDPATNTATITNSSAGDPDTSNNTDDATVTPQAADFSLNKTAADPTPDYHTNVVFTLTLTNMGPTPGVATVTDLLPEGLAFVSANPAADYDETSGRWITDVVAVGSTRVLEITATVKTVELTTNTACITKTSLPDPDESNNCDDVTITPVAADLALTKTLADFSGDPATNTITATFKLTVTNNGPSNATDVIVEDPLPAGATLVSASAAYDTTTGIWTIGTLAVGASAMLTLTLTAEAANNLINIAEVSGDQIDQDLSNNLAGSQAQHDGPNLDRFRTDLSLTKIVSNATPAAGETITYTLVVKNNGPSATAGVVVLDTLAADLEFVRASFSDATDSYDPATGWWEAGSLKVGGQATLELEVQVVGTGEVTNVAQVIKSHLPDPDSVIGGGSSDEDDFASATLTVQRAEARAAEPGPEQRMHVVNYPNPFNPQTVIEYALPEAGEVRLAVYDVLGREVTVLVDGRLPAGRYEAVFEAGELPSGLYVYRLEVGGQMLTRQMLLLK